MAGAGRQSCQAQAEVNPAARLRACSGRADLTQRAVLAGCACCRLTAASSKSQSRCARVSLTSAPALRCSKLTREAWERLAGWHHCDPGQQRRPASCLRACYAISVTDIAYAASCPRARCAMPGPDIACSASCLPVRAC
eukprot:645850-Rhodomonas_salina.3